MDYSTPPDGYRDLVPPASARRIVPFAEALDARLAHAAAPLEEALRAPETEQTPAALKVCIEATLCRIRAIAGR